MKPKPLDLDEIEKNLKRKWKKHLEEDGGSCYCSAFEESCIPEKIKFLREIKQHIKQACEFFLKFMNNPSTLLEKYEDYGLTVEDRIDIENFIEKMRNHVKNDEWEEWNDTLDKYNEWLFKLAFKDIFCSTNQTKNNTK